MHISGRWCNPGQPGFGLEAADVDAVAARLVGPVPALIRHRFHRAPELTVAPDAGRPLTFEHTGIIEAAEQTLASTGDIRAADVEKRLAANTGAAAPIGKVVAADRYGRFVAAIDQGLPMTAEAVRQRYFAVSLTHVGLSKEPLELSLTTDPARRDAWIRAHYKGQHTRLSQIQELLKMADESAPAPSPLEAALASITDPEQRAAIEAQLRAYETQFTSHEAKIAELSKHATTDEEIVKQLAAGLVEQFKDQVAPLGHADPDLVMKSPFAMRQLLEVCSRGFAERRAAASGAGAAMEVSTPAPAAVPEVPAVAEASTAAEEPPTKRARGRDGVTSEDALLRAFQRRFD